MKKTLPIGLAILALTLVGQVQLHAQSGKKKSSKNDEYFDDKGGFKQHLWYGGGFSLGFSGGNDISLFQIGVSPMVGYKLFGEFSMGPRVSFLYTNVRARNYFGGNEVDTANPVSWAAGAFARYKFLQFLFAHVEYELENEAYPVYGSSGDLEILRRQRNNAYVGLGYNGNSGGPWGFEILLIYNVNLPNDAIESPFDIRAGVTYNF